MPSINRIRVNNVKYNFGTQGYDDFSMRMYGRNTLYDLANGGGKSVLMLLLMQNLIPNCTLDDKQPIEKLFRDPSNTVIHSLIEWKLDESDIKDGMRYMTTGFAARKASGSEEERQDGTAEIEYFNYVIFYREYNKNDIVNLPLDKDNEHISYKALRNYLHDLARNDKNMLVQIFDRKGEYQKFIANYGLYESHWEIIRGINKTEGHVRTYFESHYKNTRRVIEDLLIEEIIEKAYITKTAREESKAESTANLLMTIQDELRTLSEKKKDIRLYDYEQELVELLRSRISSFLELYEEKEKNSREFGRIYLTLKNEKDRGDNKVAELEKSVAEKEEALLEAEKMLELLKLLKDIYSEEKKAEGIDNLGAVRKELEKDINMQEGLLKERLAAKEFVILKSAENELSLLDMDRKNSTDENSDIYAVVASIKSKMQQQLEKNEKKLSNIKLSLEALRKQSEEKQKALAEGYTEIAVLGNRKQYLEKDIQSADEQIRTLQNRLSKVMMGETKDLIAQAQQRIEDADRIVAESIKTDEQSIQEKVVAEKEREKLHAEKVQLELRIEELQKSLIEMQEVSSKLKSVSLVYTGKDDAPAQEIEKNLNSKILSDTYKLYEKRKELSAAEKREDEIESGRLIAATKGIEKVKEYIVTRHGKDAMFGMDYVSSLPEDMKKDILKRIPGLPYGVVVKDLDSLMEDTGLFEIDMDEEVTLYDRDSLDDVISEDTEGVAYARRKDEFYLDPSVKTKRMDILDAEISGLKEDVRIGEAMLSTLREDLDFIHLYMDKGFEYAEDDMKEAEERLRIIDHSYEKLSADILQYEAAVKNEAAKREAAEADREAAGEDIKLLEEIAAYSDRISEMRKEVREADSKKRSLTENVKTLEKKIEELRLTIMQEKDGAETISNENGSIKSKWENRFSMYYVEGAAYKEINKSLPELEMLFENALGNLSEGRMSLEKEKLLRDTLLGNIERQKIIIKDLGISVDELRKRDEQGSLKTVNDELLTEIRNKCYELKKEGERTDRDINSLRTELAKLQGSIEYATERFVEKYGEEALGLKDSLRDRLGAGQSDDAVKREIEDKKRELALRSKELDTARRELASYKKELDAGDDILKLSQRIVAEDSVNITSLVPLSDISGIRDSFERHLITHDKLSKDIDRAKADTMKVKLKVYDSLMEMNINELAGSIRDDVTTPQTAEDAHGLIDRLSEVIRIIVLEKERVEKSLVGMEKLKDSFIEECIERCLDVRSELDKLTRLSEITMDGEKIQMIRLAIPYVKDEFIKERMSEYIDDIVTEMDKKETDSDKQKFLNASLSMKKLFSVIVTDMSKIKLQLYKRERLKEQSRYLKYEEAVGSTGQSQGIYIQFLISIINYIAGMYAASDSGTRAKTLFIDNPFGAAKDIYIWEPIFTLLAENNCQLIVPARGATPEITGRFDINYILGQQMTGKRTTTVVTHFSSKTKGEELEFKDLDYEQQSFDFI